jgi:hypothetical protein
MRQCFDAVTVNAARILGWPATAWARLPRRLRAAAGALAGRGDPPARAAPAGGAWRAGAGKDSTGSSDIANTRSLEFLTGYLIEKSLAVDNIFVF